MLILLISLNNSSFIKTEIIFTGEKAKMQHTKISDDLLLLTTKLLTASNRCEIINLAKEYTNVVERLMQVEQQGNTLENKTKTVSATVKFTKQEISNMATTLKKEFIANGLVAHVIKRKSGTKNYCYEIRYRSNGFNITASSTNLEKAKQKFIAMTKPKEIEKYRIRRPTGKRHSLERIFQEWYKLKEGNITDKELKRFQKNFYDLPIELCQKHIFDVKTTDINNIMKSVAPRKYEELRTLFNGIFKYAIASGIIMHNPIALIPFKRAERQNRDCLSEKEISTFLERITQPKFDCIRQGAYLLYFFGLRPCEIDEETKKEGDFLITRNRKRKNGKIEYKKIPIPSQAQGLIDWDKPFVFDCSEWKRGKLFEELFENFPERKTAYCLRHTFATICQQYVRPDIVDIWMGDSSERLVGRVYTHFPDKFMKTQMEKVIFNI